MKANGELSERFKELVLKTSDSERNLGFESLTLRQKSTCFDKSIFLSIAKAKVYHHAQRVSHHRRCISSAVGCIFFRNDDIQGFRLGDIQNFVLMICNSFGIDDIQCSALIFHRFYDIINPRR